MEMSGIGSLNEKPLHASLKKWYARPEDRFEVEVDGFVIDIVRDDQLLEIQTGNFASIRSKLKKLVRSHRVRYCQRLKSQRIGDSSIPAHRCAVRSRQNVEIFSLTIIDDPYGARFTTQYLRHCCALGKCPCGLVWHDGALPVMVCDVSTVGRNVA